MYATSGTRRRGKDASASAARGANGAVECFLCDGGFPLFFGGRFRGFEAVQEARCRIRRASCAGVSGFVVGFARGMGVCRVRASVVRRDGVEAHGCLLVRCLSVCQ